MFIQLLLATLVAAASATDSYVVLTPSSFRPGLPLNISINILKSTAPVTVTADLISKTSGTKAATASGSFSQGSPGTLLLQVPDDLHAGSYKLLVQGTGNGLTFRNETDLNFESKSISLFIQTDKAMYKPGQTVNFRAFAVFPNLTVYTGPMDIDIFDPNSNKIKQWKGITDASGVITKFMLMDTQPVLGDWKIKVSSHGRSAEKIFEVAHYVLPKFEVTVTLPSFALTTDTTISGTVKAKYTYGKPVKGTVTLRAKLDYWYRPYNYHGDEPMVTQTFNIDGSGTFHIPLAHIQQISHYLNSRSLVVEANVTEELNSITLNGSSKVKFYDKAVKMEFLKSNPTTFKPGLPYTAYLKVSQQDGTPVMGMREDVNVSTTVTYEVPTNTQTTPYPWYQPPTRTYNLKNKVFTVPDTGIVAIQVDIPGNATHISLNAHYGSSVSAYLSLSKSYSPSNNYLQLFLKSTNLQAGQIANFQIKATETITSAVYQVMSRGSVVSAGKITGNTFSILITDKMAPNARIVVYYVRADGEIVTDSISFDVDGAFLNKVSIDFDRQKAQPHDDVHVIVTADPASIVNLLAVDQSVLLLKSGNDITASEVVNELKTYDTINAPPSPFCCDFGPVAVGRKKRMVWWPYPVYYGGSDAQQIFYNAGVKVMTDAIVYHHPQPHYFGPEFAFAFGAGGGAGGGVGTGTASFGTGSSSGQAPSLKAVTRIRSVFPETWLWSNQTTRSGYSALIYNGVVFLFGNNLCRSEGQGNLNKCPDNAKTISQFSIDQCSPLREYLQVYPFVDALGPQPAMALGGGVLSGHAGGGIAPVKETTLMSVDHVRNVFPETWLWTNNLAGPDGKVNITTTVPDTITSWIASAFAVNSMTGLGVAPTTAKIEAFRPFFVSLNLPYSVVRGEQVALQANVFNYMAHDMNVLVTLNQSADFKNVIVDSSGNVQYVSQQQTATVHVVAGEAKSVYFPIVPAGLGKIDILVKAQSTLAADAVQRQLLIEPEGVPKEYNTPVLVDLKNTTNFSRDVSLSMPAGVVAGSQRVVVTAIGDLMGPTVNGLDKLLRMPTGCGEQTMIGFAPDVFITNYLKATNQLTSDIEEKAMNYMEKGYQRELTYQHKDGSFSAFGDRDKSGSMWLSAFVTKTFHQAKRLIFIDDKTISRAIEWMINHQESDGHFPEPGRVIHTDMQGGSASGPGLTSFVLISLLENNDLGGTIQPKINAAALKAQRYLESQIASVTDDYVLAIASYALKLAGSSSFPTAFNKLNNNAIVKDGMKHWHKAQTTSASHHWRPAHQQSNPIDIEMTSYALLIQALKNDFAGGMPIMKWITSQRNSNGGFASTQDTVVGLQALSDFARMVYSSNFDIRATMTAGNFTHTFTINQNNALILQSVVLPSIPSQVSITATGHGMALVDVSLSFNVEQEIEEVSFDIQVTLVKESMDLLSIKTCAKWLHTGSSGMAVQEFGIPTGFEADLESIAGVTEIKRTETGDRKIILYFDEISTTPICLTLDIIRTGLVAKTQPAAIRIYDYYQPGNQVTKFYQSQVLQNSGICDVCANCGCSAPAGR